MAIKHIVLLLLSILLGSDYAKAQDVIEVKNLIVQNRLLEAKSAMEILLQSKPKDRELSYLLSEIYLDIYLDKKLKDKYLGYLDSSKIVYLNLIKTETNKDYDNQYVILFSKIKTTYFNEGSSFYNAALKSKATDDYLAAFTSMRQAYDFAESVQPNQIDTLARYFAAISAVKCGKEIEGLIASKKLFENNIIGHGNTSFYQLWQWQAYYYVQNQQNELMDRFVGKANLAFPGTSYFSLQQAILAEKTNNSIVVAKALSQILDNNLAISQDRRIAFRLGEKALKNLQFVDKDNEVYNLLQKTASKERDGLKDANSDKILMAVVWQIGAWNITKSKGIEKFGKNPEILNLFKSQLNRIKLGKLRSTLAQKTEATKLIGQLNSAFRQF